MRERRNHLTLVGLIVAALIGVALLAVPSSPFHKGTTLGLDLQGGLEVVLKAVPPKGHELTGDDLDRSVDIMRNRIDKLGVAEPELRKQGSDQIVIQLAGVTDPEKAAELIGKTAQLELYDLEQDLIGPVHRRPGRGRDVAPVRPPGRQGWLGARRTRRRTTYSGRTAVCSKGRSSTREAALHEEAPAGTEGRQGPRRREGCGRRLLCSRQRSRRVLPTRRRAGRTTTSSATSRTTPRTRSRR